MLNNIFFLIFILQILYIFIMNINKEDSKNFGIVYTPDPLVNKILDLIPRNYYSNPSLRWLDIGAGNGAFSINLYNRLFNDLSNSFNSYEETKDHIIKNMIYMCEIYPPHIEKLKTHFSQNANIINKDFLALNKYEYESFDFIIGNPPYNINGALKTPTNNSLKKTDDGKQIYVEFINKSLSLLYNEGHLAIIIPTLWMKPDKAGLYNTLTNSNFSIKYLHCLSTTQTQKEFLYQAQTPTCYLCGEVTQHATYEFNDTKTEKSGQDNPKIIPIYDKIHKKYIDYKLRPNYPIPTHGINIINKLLYYVDQVGYLKVYKSNTPPKNSKFSDTPFLLDNLSIAYGAISPSPQNIKTTKISKKTPVLIKNYSNILQPFANQPKLILAHKMYGFPFLDISGIYGISSRDNYILTGITETTQTEATKKENKKTKQTKTKISGNYSINELQQIQAFLSTKTALFVFSTTNYRMRYLERYAFQFLPNITKLKDFPNLLNSDPTTREKLIINFFNFSQLEEKNINNLSQTYNHFIDNK